MNTVEAKSGRYPWGVELVDRSSLDFIEEYYDHELYYVHGHILVFRHDGSFAFSADTVEEAKRDVEEHLGG